MGGEEGHCLLSWKGHFASVESTYNMKGETWWAPQYFCHAPLVSAIAVIMVRSTPQTRVAYNKQHLCLSLPRVWAPAKIPWAGTQGSSLCVSLTGTGMKEQWPPGARPSHSTQVYLKPLFASPLLTGHRPKQIAGHASVESGSPCFYSEGKAGS